MTASAEPSVPVSDPTLTAARQWAAEDPDPDTAEQLRVLIQQAESGHEAAGQELADAFSGTLQFGTAGLRAALGAGPMRMNRAVVRRAAAGLAAFLLEAVDGRQPRAVVGYDARHKSDIFAQETAAIFTAAGIDAFLLPSALPTPLLAYAVRALDCDGGVMVTASHNPPQDNGYKVYLGGRAVDGSGRGAQIVPPYDERIAARIAAVDSLASIPLAPSGWTVLPEATVQEYSAAVTDLARRREFPARDLKIVLTPMHGVGGSTAVDVLSRAGFADVTVVPEQADPDPDFPTVNFPNPEEPGALDLALALAAATNADVVLANDPDADRAAMAARDPSTGQWRMLRGDEVGALLGAHIVARLSSDGAADGTAGKRTGVLASSIVSSRLLARIAAAAGYGHVTTLTGFKWISRVPGLLYGYEEALGYCVAPELVRDKDGISAALLLAELAAEAKAKGRTVFDTLDDLALQHGLHASDQLSIRVADLSQLETMMSQLRNDPPVAFGGSAVESCTDLATGSDALPPTDGLLYLCRNQTRVIIRPSGTEPKLKCYLEVLVPVEGRASLPLARNQARAELDAVLADVQRSLAP